MYQGILGRSEVNVRTFTFPQVQTYRLEVTARQMATASGLPPRSCLPRIRVYWGDGIEQHDAIYDLAGHIALLLAASRVRVSVFADVADNITPTAFVPTNVYVASTCAPGSGPITQQTYTTEMQPCYTSAGGTIPLGARTVRAERIVALPFPPAGGTKSPSLPPGYLGLYSPMLGTPGDPFIYTAYDLPSLVERRVEIPAACSIPSTDTGGTSPAVWWYTPPTVTLGPGETFRLVWGF